MKHFFSRFKAAIIAVFTLCLAISIYYPHEVSKHKQQRLLQVTSDFNWIKRDLNQQIEQLSTFFDAQSDISPDCGEKTLRELRKAHFRIPNVAEFGIVNPAGELICTSWQKLKTPIDTSGPKPDKNRQLRFFGPIHTSFIGEAALVIAKTRTDGYEINALLPQKILTRHISELGESYQFIAIVATQSGVPISLDGQYTLPISPKLFPLEAPTQLVDTQFDDSKQHVLIAQSLTELPSLSLVLAVEQSKLFKGVYRPSIISLIIYFVVFMFSFAFVHAYQYRYLSRKSKLKQNIKAHNFVNHYQFIWDARQNGFTGAESLVRLIDPVEGMLYPNDFIDDIEKYKLLDALTCQVITNIDKDLPKLFQRYNINKVNLNVSGEQLKNKDVVKSIITLSHHVPQLVLEITENELVETNNQSVMQTLAEFKQQGILLALDDFGTGYAGIQYLKSLPLDIIKIDKSYIAAIGTGSQLANMLDALIELANALKIDVVAEGVETKQQAEYLIEKKVYLHQGWLYHKASSVEDV